LDVQKFLSNNLTSSSASTSTSTSTTSTTSTSTTPLFDHVTANHVGSNVAVFALG
jgi:hypothetical protein